MSFQLAIRKSFDTATDTAFLMAAWIHGTRYTPQFFFVPYQLFRPYQEQVIKSILERGAEVLIAYNKEDDDQMVGFLCFERLADNVLLHYCYIKEEFRGFGIAKELVKASGANMDQPLLISTSSKDIHNMFKKKRKFIQIIL